MTYYRHRWWHGRQTKHRRCHECNGTRFTKGPSEKWQPYSEARQQLLDLGDIYTCGSCWGTGVTGDDSVELAELEEIIAARKEAADE